MSLQHPLVMRCGAFGDMVLLTALLRQLHLRFGTQTDLIASGPWTVPLLEGQPGVGEIFILRSRKSPHWASRSQQRLVRWLKSRGAGPTWFCDSGAGRDLLRRGGVPDNFVYEDQALPRLPGEHFVDRWIRFANGTPPAFTGMLPPSQKRIDSNAALSIDATERSGLDLWLTRRELSNRELILLQTGNKRTMRGWLREPRHQHQILAGGALGRSHPRPACCTAGRCDPPHGRAARVCTQCADHSYRSGA